MSLYSASIPPLTVLNTLSCKQENSTIAICRYRFLCVSLDDTTHVCKLSLMLSILQQNNVHCCCRSQCGSRHHPCFCSRQNCQCCCCCFARCPWQWHWWCLSRRIRPSCQQSIHPKREWTGLLLFEEQSTFWPVLVPTSKTFRPNVHLKCRPLLMVQAHDKHAATLLCVDARTSKLDGADGNDCAPTLTRASLYSISCQ